MRTIFRLTGMAFMCLLFWGSWVNYTHAEVVVIDANRTVLGQAINVNGAGDSAALAFSVTLPFAITTGEPAFFPIFLVVLSATKNRLIAPTFGPLWQTPDCTGTPLMDVNQAGGIGNLISSPIFLVSQLNPGQDVLGKVYVGVDNGTPQSVMIHSKIDDHNPTGCLDLGVNSFHAMVFTTSEIMDLDAQFVPPFHL